MSKPPEIIGMNMALVAGFLSLKTTNLRFTLSMLPFCFHLNLPLLLSSITLSPKVALANWSGHDDGLSRQNCSYRLGLGFSGLGFHHVDNLKGLIMTTYTPTIAYHAKSELRGWNEVCRYPADWEGWHSFDKSMIDELLKNGSQVVTCGWNMYQVVNDSV